MRFILFLLLLMSSSTAMALGPDPQIRACGIVEQRYGSWAIGLRRLVEKNSSDIGERVDASLITDINFALVSAKDFVHENIQYVQRAGAEGGRPSARECQDVTAMARDQIEQYVGHLLSEVPASDRGRRESYLREFQLGLQRSTREFQGRRG